MELFKVSFLLFHIFVPARVVAGPLQAQQFAQDFPITKAPFLPQRRQEPRINVATCGFKDGDLNQPRVAEPNWNCVVNADDGYWGFCQSNIEQVSDCPVDRACVDLFDCSEGCGRQDIRTTLQCTGDAGYCISDLLIAGPGQTYSYLQCDTTYRTDVFSAASEFVTRPGTTTDAPTASETADGSVPAQTQASNGSPSEASTGISGAGVTGASTSVPTASVDETAAPSEPGSKESSSSSSSTNVGVIVGGVIGGVAVILLAGILWMLWKRRSRSAYHPASKDPYPPDYSSGSQKYARSEEHRSVLSIPPTELPAHVPLSEMSGSSTPIDPRELDGESKGPKNRSERYE